MSTKLDVVFVAPNSATAAYQALADRFAAVEPPTWALLLAESCRTKGFSVAIVDADAERLTPEAAALRVSEMAPRLVCVVVYGQNPNSGTINMTGAVSFIQSLKNSSPPLLTCIVGSHVSALPDEVLDIDGVDLVLLNEGVYALHNLLISNLEKSDFKKIKGIGFKDEGIGILNEPERIVPQDRMDIDLPGYAWDLLPFRTRPLDLYRAHVWHAGFDESKRSPFAAIYTSLGCRYGCDFCMINIVNRTSNAVDTSAADSRIMRFWSTELIIRELVKLQNLGVSTVRISDEMFFLNRNYFQPFIESPVLRELQMNLWAYARIDTVREKYLESFKAAGINWLALGIESGAQNVRREVSKGTFKDINIREVVGEIRTHNINVISNYIFGFPDEGLSEMQATLDLALELNTEMANMYPCQALPGSPLYVEARRRGVDIPRRYEEFGFLSYQAKPLPTKHVSAATVLQFRDNAWQTYFTNPAYLSLVEEKFGIAQRHFVEAMTQVPLRRALLEREKS